ncbi:glycosyltransferase 8 domain-containing protein 1 isoform X1 [Chiloscyllium plagiosum]|uniref:glycosyltransferase 8 domain-containing protein 1 isoform X1 n=1 Tax=Chiloscyllium plagiosum TaxID=36176 RepID=UPI001CB8377F|nr:glycosyltransferase 8 domain-containing protein 1 isoform X1 [Chiloscyllium plagiosum]XP_043563799.1 glycosyltransferase 8 domain-containing protein 1 isoform X1 [Chiloscyllium plagiosum]XP_043563800.1 glycosyltransferase 8 domain-containing protein 1 isoform X1 [Chiloscyllium plagiosum]XP_043563801.1 glycosyltransferase 8 domain-containing protein 1 isoform X1 [Chiloscyllium plagiosum]
MPFRKAHILIILLVAIVLLIVMHHNLFNANDLLRKENSDSKYNGVRRIAQERTGEEIPILIPAVEERLGGVIAAINSIYSNTRSNVIFYVVTTNDTIEHLRAWLQKEELMGIKHKILRFDPRVLKGKVQDEGDSTEIKPLTFARFYLPILISATEKVIYLDDDVIVQGDIRELYDTELKAGHAAAFSEDCDSVSSKLLVRGAGSQNTYLGFLDYKKETIRKLGMKASTCSFNPGVFVANLTEWKQQNITEQLERWMEINVVENLYGGALAGSVTTPPMLLVFYKQYSSIDPLWHVRYLGSNAGTRYSSHFIKAAKLLHWNGRFKPWGRTSSYSDIWDRWYIPDPTGKFHPVRRHAEDEEAH